MPSGMRYQLDIWYPANLQTKQEILQIHNRYIAEQFQTQRDKVIPDFQALQGLCLRRSYELEKRRNVPKS